MYNYATHNLPVQKNGIRCISVNYFGGVIDENSLEKYNRFIGKEYLLTEKSQYFPLYE